MIFTPLSDENSLLEIWMLASDRRAQATSLHKKKISSETLRSSMVSRKVVSLARTLFISIVILTPFSISSK